MAKTIFTKTSDGVQSVYAVNFDLGYLDDTAHVFIYTGSDYTTQLAYTWASPTSITLNPVPANGVEFYIRRVVPRHSLINDFSNGAILRESEIDNSFLQIVMLFEEVEDGFMATVSPWVVNGDVDMAGNSILNLAEIQANDIKNAGGDSLLAVAQASADAAEVSNVASTSSASASAGSATAASTSASASATSAAAAVVSAADALATEVRVAGAENTMGAVQFFANMELNRNKFAGSGFVEMGKHFSGAGYTPVNQGVYSREGVANVLALGRVSSAVGDSRTDKPMINAAGALLSLDNGNATIGWELKFPPAPDGTDIVINGEFTADTNWTKGAGWTISGGVANLTSGSYSSMYQNAFVSTPIIGDTLLLEYEVKSAFVLLKLADGAASFYGTDRDIPVTVGVHRIELPVVNAIAQVVFRGTGTAAQLDNVRLISKAERSRHDLGFLEVWHEKITTKDWVVPYGCVQSGLTTFDGVTLTNSVGNPAAGYSAYGAWETSPVVGYGAVWSTLAAADKAKFLAEPLNNIYLNAAGELIQARERIRSMAGQGTNWGQLTPNDNSYLRYAASNHIKAQGVSITPTDITAFDSNLSYHAAFHADFKGEGDLGAFTIPDGSATPELAGVDGRCFAVPIALVQRRNQGVWHEVFNRYGCAKPSDDLISLLSAVVFASTKDCFDPAKTLAGSGSIASGKSGRPDGLFYDAIYAADVKDLRLGAHKVQDYQRTIEREFNTLVDGSLRGWEGEYSGKTPLNTSGYNATAGYGTWVNISDTHMSSVIASLGLSNSDLMDGINILLTVSGVVVSRAITKVTKSASGVSFYFSDGVDESSNIDMAAGAVVPFGLGDRSVAKHFAETSLHCDIIGDPASYPQSWKDNGVFGTPLLVHEDGSNLIPDGTSKNYKMSRKVASYLMTVYSTDSGVTWASGNWSAIAGSANEQVGTDAAGLVRMVFYFTKANPLELAVNAEVLALGDVWAGAHNQVEFGGALNSQLVSKIPTDSGVGAVQQKPLTSWRKGTTAKLLTGDPEMAPAHDTLALSSIAPAAKVLPYLSRENGRAYLNLLYKEMIWDTTLDDGTEFTDTTGASLTPKVVGTWYHVTDGQHSGYWLCVKAISTDFNNDSWSRRGDDLIWPSGLAYFKAWDGNGWGDNNAFSVLDNEDTETDDNGQTILIGTKRVELPFLIRGDE